MSTRRRFQLILGPALLSLASCQSGLARKYLKAKAAPVTPFLDQRRHMRPAPERVPFHYVWRNFDSRVQQEVARRATLYIAPVELRYLQPVSKNLARWEMENGWTPRREHEAADFLRREFASAFARSPSPRWIVVNQPSADSLTLEMAITQLNPTSVRGNAGKLAA